MLARVLFLWLAMLVSGYSAQPSWQKLTDCALISNRWNDGDSFHVNHGGTEYIFRLYFVDCPETDNRFPERVKTQAEYFATSSSSALRLGHEASQFAFSVLQRPFSVYTCWQKAPGSSKLPRYYALVLTKQGWLDRLLVQNGLARIYGKRITLPDGMSSLAYRNLLQKLELTAKASRKGGWREPQSNQVTSGLFGMPATQ